MRLLPLLDRIVADPGLHARMVNTLSRMEYVGARKIFKARPSELLDSAGLQHALEETTHALRLKRSAEKLAELAGDPSVVATYAEPHTLAGDAGEDYIQGVDAAAEAALGDLAEPRRGEANYLLSSLAIEIRALAFYPVYDRCLERAGGPFRVHALFQDEVRHLAAMERALDAFLPDWRERVDQVLAQEELLFECWLDQIEIACRVHSGRS